MKILVTGASGQLGYDCVRVLKARGHEVLGVSSKEFPLTDIDTMKFLVMSFGPEAIIHSAAYTAVDLAEDDAAKCLTINAAGTRNVAALAKELGAKLIYISTDYVFNGEGDEPYGVDAPKAPLNIYGKSKLLGEVAVEETITEFFIVRISWVFGEHGRNFVKTMLNLADTNDELKIVADQIGSPTYTADLAELLADMIVTDKYGCYHATNEGFCSWAEFAAEIFRLAGKSTAVKPRLSADYPTKAIRPHNSRLSKASLTEGGFKRLPPWQDALARYLSILV